VTVKIDCEVETEVDDEMKRIVRRYAAALVAGSASARVSPLISGTGVLRVAKGRMGMTVIIR